MCIKMSCQDHNYSYTGDITKSLLLIYGCPGSGRTSLAHKILSSYRYLVIDTKYLKDPTLETIMRDHICKQDIISIMSSCKQKGLLLDNIESFHKYDKKGFSCMIDICKQQTNTKIVIVCHESFVKHRGLLTLTCEPICLSYTHKAFYDIAKTILSPMNDTMIREICQQARGNFHTIYKRMSHEVDLIYEIPDSLAIAKDIFKNPHKYTYEIVKTLPDTHTISSHLLENIARYIYTAHRKGIDTYSFERRLCEIYQRYVYADIMETYMVSHIEWSLQSHIVYQTLYSLILYLQTHAMPYNKQIYFTKYISRSITSTSNQRILREITNIDEIYRYLYYRYVLHQEVTFHADVTIDKKQSQLLSQVCAICYHFKLSPPKLLDLFTRHL